MVEGETHSYAAANQIAAGDGIGDVFAHKWKKKKGKG